MQAGLLTGQLASMAHSSPHVRIYVQTYGLMHPTSPVQAEHFRVALSPKK